MRRPASAGADRQCHDGSQHDPMRDVLDAPAVFGIEVVRVLRLACFAKRERAAIAELVVVAAAPRVVKATAPTVGDAAFEHRGNGMVAEPPAAGLLFEYVPELRKRSQK